MDSQAHPSNPIPDTTPTATNGAPPAAPAAAAAIPAPVAAPSPAAAFHQSTPLDRTPTRKLLDGDGDTLPDDADAFEISKTSFKKRLERYSRTQLKQLFGTDNPEEIMAWKTQNEAFVRQQEEYRLSQLSESERYKVQFEKAANDAARWKQQYETLQESHTIREQDRQMTSVAQKYVHPKLMNALMMEFATHLQGVDERDIGEPQTYADKWFAKYIEENPEFGVPQAPGQVGAPSPAAQAALQAAGLGVQAQSVNLNAGVPAMTPRQVQVPISNGATPNGRPANAVPAGSLTQKTLAPGQPNSMSDDEVRRWKRENGYTF